MRIAFQNLFGKQYEGGANWLEVTLHSVGLLAQPPHCLLLGATPELLPRSLVHASHIEVVPLQPVPQTPAGRVIASVTRLALRRSWEDRSLTDVDSQYKIDLWVGFSGFEGLGAQRKLLVWYPDFQFRHFPEFFSTQELRDRERQWNYVASRADGIIAISGSVAADALHSHPNIKAKIHVCGFPPVFQETALQLDPQKVRERYHLPPRFFLICNQFWTHKNHALVLQALRSLRESGETPPVVAFTGRTHDYRNPDAFSELLQYVHAHDLNSVCRFLGVVQREEQIALIRAAEAVIHPSRFEGRGAIVEESYVLGTQVLCSDLPVHRELNAPGTLFFSVDGVEELAQLIMREYPHSLKSSASIAEDSRRLSFEYGERFMSVCQAVAEHPRA